MRGLRIPILIVIVFSFALGIGWGVKLQRAREEAEGKFRTATTIRVLSLPGILPKELIVEYQKREATRIDVTLAPSPEDAWTKLENEGYDVAMLFSDQASSAGAEGLLEKLEFSSIPGLANISADFTPSQSDPASGHVASLLWAVTGFVVDPTSAGQPLPASWSEAFANSRLKDHIRLMRWSATLRPVLELFMPQDKVEASLAWKRPLQSLKALSRFEKSFRQPITDEDLATEKLLQVDHSMLAFASKTAAGWKFVLPSEGATLWTLGATMPKTSTHPIEARKFIDFLLERASAMKMTQSAMAGSTLKLVEDSGLHFSLKPSHLRSLPLTRLQPIAGAIDMAESRLIYDSLGR